MLRLFFSLCGAFLIALWLIGVILPVIPGWPFLIPALYCFYKASPKLTKRLISSPKVRRFIPEKILKNLDRKLGETR